MITRNLPYLKNFFLPVIYSLIGSFIIAFGWNWYHIKHEPWLNFWLYTIARFFGIFIVYFLFKKLFFYLVRRFQRHPFWQNEFIVFLDQLFFVGSLLFILFFIREEWQSVVYVLIWLIVFYWRFQHFLARHPAGESWIKINRIIFVLTYFLFVLTSLVQYVAFKYYILDSNIKYYNIVVFRSLAMTMLWLFGFSVASLLYWLFRKSFIRYLFFFFWGVIFLFILAVWIINSGIVYFSGLYFSPIALEHSGGAGGLYFNWLTYLLFFIGISALSLFVVIFKKIIRAHSQHKSYYWHYYNFAIIAMAIISLLTIASFGNTPEFIMLKSFYSYYIKRDYKQAVLSPIVQAKLERFGIFYDLDKFYVAEKTQIFDQGKKLLPAKFSTQKPNIIIVFWESFSSRFNGVYNPNLYDLTPGINEMAKDKNTTIFRNYFNGSTPTVTGLMSQLCSFLPPTGHNEIEREKKMQRHHLLCLPQALEYNGYKYSAYVTAVSKDFAHKDTIMESMGIKETYGTDELAKFISGEPLSWGYSDHQMFLSLWDIIDKKSKEPFLLMFSTVDTHPPYDMAKDMVYYKDGKNRVLNSFHTTDDAFGKFWNKFKNSEYYDNTILVVVGDHAIFPTAVTSDVFPKDSGKVNYYDENSFMMYVPETVLPKEVKTYSSGIDFAPTLLHMLNINTTNAFDGHSIFDDRNKYPDLLGMHEFGLYINQIDESGKRKTEYNIPSEINCLEKDFTTNTSSPLTLCEYLNYYQWKRQMFEEGRLWAK